MGDVNTKHFRQKILYFSLSIVLIFHLLAIFIAPNHSNYLGARLGVFLEPYVSFLEIGSSWGFFAPDPGPPPLFVEYEVVGADGKILKADLWPARKSPFFIRERQNQRISVARFVMRSNDRLEKMMGHYLCVENRDAKSVRLWALAEPVPHYTDVAAGRRVLGDRLNADRRWIAQYVCGGR